jgi:nicotinic acetylcholine receptor alpha-1
LVLAVLAGLVFALPVESGEKISFSITLLLAFAVNLSVLFKKCPTPPSTCPTS